MIVGDSSRNTVPRRLGELLMSTRLETAYFVCVLYIVPMSLWTVLGLAHRRGDLKQLWNVGPYSDGGLKQTTSPPPPNTVGGSDSGRETGMGEGLLGGEGVTAEL